MDLISDLGEVVRVLDERQIAYGICGGLAVAFHGYVRATVDIDFLVREENIAAIFTAVETIGFNLEGGTIPVGFGEEHPCTIYRISKAAGRDLTTLDFIAVNPTLEPVWNSREQHVWHGRSLWVVSLAGLGIMKRLSNRPTDRIDLEKLGLEQR